MVDFVSSCKSCICLFFWHEGVAMLQALDVCQEKNNSSRLVQCYQFANKASACHDIMSRWNHLCSFFLVNLFFFVRGICWEAQCSVFSFLTRTVLFTSTAEHHEWFQNAAHIFSWIWGHHWNWWWGSLEPWLAWCESLTVSTAKFHLVLPFYEPELQFCKSIKLL